MNLKLKLNAVQPSLAKAIKAFQIEQFNEDDPSYETAKVLLDLMLILDDLILEVVTSKKTLGSKDNYNVRTGLPLEYLQKEFDKDKERIPIKVKDPIEPIPVEIGQFVKRLRR